MLLLAQFGVQAVQPVVTLYVQQLVGPVPALATFGGLAFSVTGVADLIASPFLGRRSRRAGLPPGAADRARRRRPGQRAAGLRPELLELRRRPGSRLGLFVGGILPTANALVGRLAPAGDRGTVYGVTASAMFLGQSLGPLSGGAIAAILGPALGLPGHRHPARRQPRLGLAESPGSPLTRRQTLRSAAALHRRDPKCGGTP